MSTRLTKKERDAVIEACYARLAGEYDADEHDRDDLEQAVDKLERQG